MRAAVQAGGMEAAQWDGPMTGVPTSDGPSWVLFRPLATGSMILNKEESGSTFRTKHPWNRSQYPMVKTRDFGCGVILSRGTRRWAVSDESCQCGVQSCSWGPNSWNMRRVSVAFWGELVRCKSFVLTINMEQVKCLCFSPRLCDEVKNKVNL